MGWTKRTLDGENIDRRRDVIHDEEGKSLF